ncbi:MAG: fused MFS/spermidine synthase [Terriglobales bacterium]
MSTYPAEIGVEAEKSTRWPTVAAYALTIFLSAFLLFQVQPLIAKYFLPWFGGTPAVWTTCLVFFQVLLLGGYSYAHLLTRRRTSEGPDKWHLLLLASSLVLLASLGRVWESPITPGAAWVPAHSQDPRWHLLALLTISVGLPYFVLSTTGPLLQAWYGRVFPASSPYRLYALSNLGSLGALASYPFIVEPALTLRTQARIWAWGYFAFALCCAFCALQTASGQAAKEARSGEPVLTRSGNIPAAIPGKGLCALWVSLAACASLMLLATTNWICQEVSVIPFLWVLPLGLYLLSFILCFHSERWYVRSVFHPALALAIVMACSLFYRGPRSHVLAQIGICSFALFACCMVCHGELARLKPSGPYLTRFYLWVATGGAAGGIFVALLAPWLFRGYWELGLGLWGSALLLFLVLAQDRYSWLYRGHQLLPVLLVVGAALLPGWIFFAAHPQILFRDWRLPLLFLLALALVAKVSLRKRAPTTFQSRRRWAQICAAAALAILGAVLFLNTRQKSIVTSRNFYGVLSVIEINAHNPELDAYKLVHGPVDHGVQYRSNSLRDLPTAYFSRQSGVGLAILNAPRRRASRPEDGSLRVGVVGLGVGTIAAYAQPGDYFRFYEINPDVVRFSQEGYFTYLRDSVGRVDVVLGDARLSMKRELDMGQPQQFDVLVLDAFNGDAIPVHLLSQEAFEIYLRHLNKADGILAIHVSNLYLDLRQVVWKAAEHFGLAACWIHTSGEGPLSGTSDWMLLAENPAVLKIPAIAEASSPQNESNASLRIWTDDYSNLFQILKK